MKTLDYYLLRAVSRPLATTLALALLVLLLERMVRVLDLVLGSNGTLNLVLRILASLMPQYAGVALPLALFLGILIGLRRMSRDSELVTLESAGVGLHQMLRPIMLMSLLVCLLTTATLSYLQPMGRYAYRAMLFSLKNTFFEVGLEPGVFMSLGETTFMTEELSKDRQRAERIFIYNQAPNGDWSTVTARSGALLDAGLASPRAILLRDGLRLSGLGDESASDTLKAKPLRSEDNQISNLDSIFGDQTGVLVFTAIQAILDQEQLSLAKPRGTDERELTLIELWQRRETPPPDVDPEEVVAEFHGRLVRMLSVLVLPMLAMALAHGRTFRGRSMAIPLGVVLLIVYNEVLDFGENFSESGLADPLFSLWLPFGVFTLGSIVYFRNEVLRVGGGPSLTLRLPRLRSGST